MRRGEYEPTDLRGRERLDAASEKHRAFLERQEREDLVRLASEMWGRRFLWGLMPAGDPFDSNALTMANRLGQQKSGRELERMLRSHCLDSYFQMIRENEKPDDDTADDARNDQS